MASKGKWLDDRPKSFYVKWRDATGRQRYESFSTAAERDQTLERLLPKLRQQRGLAPVHPTDTLLGTYAATWLKDVADSIKPRTLEAYTKAVMLYLVPGLGTRPVAALRRPELRRFLRECRRCGVRGRRLKAASVYAIYAALRALLNAAVEDELLVGNPATRLGKVLKLGLSAKTRHAEIGRRALDREQLQTLLEYIRTADPAWYPLFLTLARAGLRIGECLALEPRDYNPTARTLRIERAWDDKTGVLGEPKHGPRTVDVSEQLAAILDAHLAGLRKVVTIASGQPVTTWLFGSRAGTMLEVRNVRRALRRVTARAVLGRLVRLHDLRHTFGSQLIAAGKSPVYVQRQMGHASIETTIRFYGSELPMEDRRGVDALDVSPAAEAGGCKMVAKSGGRRRRRDASA